MKYNGVFSLEMLSFTNVLDTKDQSVGNKKSLIDPARDL